MFSAATSAHVAHAPQSPRDTHAARTRAITCRTRCPAKTEAASGLSPLSPLEIIFKGEATTQPLSVSRTTKCDVADRQQERNPD
jgi:hypothetical protein